MSTEGAHFVNEAFEVDGYPVSASSDHHQISLAWRNLRYEVPDYSLQPSSLIRRLLQPVRRPLLRRLNGHVRSGSLTALMGPSGAGKTTLLNCLAGQATGKLTSESEILINGAFEKSWSAVFVEQHAHESIIGSLTVGQLLMYAFRFKNGLSVSAKVMHQHIESILHDLMLLDSDSESTRASILDRPFSRCSGGEQKRVAIGQELTSLLHPPKFLFIDEPTTGLDSSAAVEVSRCLQRLTSTHPDLTILASIHVPSEEVIRLFDHLYVLARGGISIYSGPPVELCSFLKQNISLHLTFNQSPIEALMKIACEEVNLPGGHVPKLANQILANEYQMVSDQIAVLKPGGLQIRRKSFTCTDFCLQLARQFQLIFVTEWHALVAQFVFFTVLTLTVASFFNSKMVHPSGCIPLDGNQTACDRSDYFRNLLLNEHINYLWFQRTVQGFIILCANTLIFTGRIKVFRSEHRNLWYSLGSFYWATTLTTLIQLALFALLFSTLSYFAVSEHLIDPLGFSWTRFGHYTAITLLNLAYIQSVAQGVGVTILNPHEIALLVSTVLYLLQMMLDDFFFKTDELRLSLYVEASNVLGIKYLTRYLLWIFYGLNRCHPEKEYSWILPTHYVDPTRIWYYALRILINIMILKLITYVIMYLRHSWIKVQKIQTKLDSKIIELDFGTMPLSGIILRPALIEQKMIGPIKSVQDFSFEHFSRHKVSIAFRDLSLFPSGSLYEQNEHQTKHQKGAILKNLNGELRFGTLTAIMGMSGAGKTSLLKVLNGRGRSRLSSSTRFYLSRYTQIETVFITQEVSGHLFRGLTARQMLIYASRLKNSELDQSGTVIAHGAIADRLLQELRLEDAAHTKSELCSGGERKRLALALELTSLVPPNLICIDEPTSGLDSNSAQTVVSCIHSLAHKHSLTIVTAIHQPNSDLLSMFDQLYVLGRGGQCLFFGPQNQISVHLAQVSELLEPENLIKNPIEILINHSCSGTQTPVIRRLIELTQDRILSEIDLLKQTQPVPEGVCRTRRRFSLLSVHILNVRYLTYIRGYLWKEWLIFLALFLIYAANLIIFFDPAIAIPSGCIDYEADFNSTECSAEDEKRLGERQVMIVNIKYNLFVFYLFVLLVLMQAALALYREMDLFLNEHRNGWYSSGAFYIQKAIFEMAPMVPATVLYLHITDIYSSVRLDASIHWHMVALLLANIICTHGLVYIILFLCGRRLIPSLIVGISIFFLFTLLGNLFISLRNVHYVYYMLSHISFARFGFEALILLEYGFGRCGPRQIQSLLEWMALKDEDYRQCWMWLIVLMIFYRGLGFWVLVGTVNPSGQIRPQSAERIKTIPA